MSRASRPRPGFTLIELLVVIAIIAVLIALLLPAIQAAREAARRAQCLNNLMQLSIAIQNYESAHEVLPPGVVNPGGPISSLATGYHMSWLAQILPYLEQRNVYNHLNFSKGAYAGENLSSRSMTLATFLCPSNALPGRSGGPESPGLNNYAGCHHPREAPIDADNLGVLFLNSHVRYDDITDGSANTLFVGEKPNLATELGWLSGTRSTLRNAGNTPNQYRTRIRGGFAPAPPVEDDDTPNPGGGGKPPVNPGLRVGGFESPHPGGVNFAFGDGSVKFIKDSINAAVFQALANRADGDLISSDQY